MKIKKNLLLKMDSDELHIFLKTQLVTSCLREFKLDKCLPMHNFLLEGKEIIID